MKTIVQLVACFAMLAFGTATVVKKDHTITQVVKLLQGMLDKSKVEGEEETELYGKFKCYCDKSETEKTLSIKEKTEQIALLEAQISETQGDTGELSSDCAKLKTSMAENQAARDEAETLRKKENSDFLAEEADLEQAIGQMKNAIETLSAVGADQTASTGADNKQFMAGHKASSLLSVQQALQTASALMTTSQRSKTSAFLQAPFTGTYSSQSAQVLGIIKNMRDTFKKNLGDARKTESDSQETYDEFMKLKTAAFKEMEVSYANKQKDLSSNDKELSTDRNELAEAQKLKASDEEFLSKLVPLCEDKAKGYASRKVLRANEEAAVAEAISILNSDSAYETFATTDATSDGATSGKFIQLRSVRKHMDGQHSAQQVLEKAAAQTKSARLLKVVASMRAENAFDTVLVEIDNMIEVIAEEGKSDKKKLDWCNTERSDNKATHAKKEKAITALENSIDKLTKEINTPETGLLSMIQQTEKTLVDNNAAQKDQTSERTEDNVAYQKDISNLVEAQRVLHRALKVLKTYYDDLESKLKAGEALLQEDPTPPDAWKGDGADSSRSYSGQKSAGSGVMDMLEFIVKQTKAEETNAHSTEEQAQADYEDSMTGLKKEQATSEQALSDFQEKLAKKQKDLLDDQEDLKLTTKDKKEIEEYLAGIKPGCDFITTNIKLRNANRATEKAALDKAVKLIKATPAYKTAVNAATVESYGDCKEPCVADAEDVKCKACMADVTIPAYCAGHKGTSGC